MADEDITLDGKPLQSLRVADLKAALEQRNLPKNGQKNALVKRLKGALMLENLQKSSSSHSGLQPNSQIGEEMSQNSFIKQYLAKQQELLRQRLEREAQQEEEADESPAVQEEEDDHMEENNSSSFMSDKLHRPLPSQPPLSRAVEHGEVGPLVGHGMTSRRPDLGQGSSIHRQEYSDAPGAWMQRAPHHPGQKEPLAPSPPRAVASLSVRVLGQPDHQGLPPAVPRAQEKEGTAPNEPGSAHPVLHLSRSAGVAADGHLHDDSDDDDDGDDESEDDEEWGPGPGVVQRSGRGPSRAPQPSPSAPLAAGKSKRKLQPPQHIPPPQVHQTPMQLRHPTPPPSPPPELSFPLPDTPKQSPPDTDDPEGEGPEAGAAAGRASFRPPTMKGQDSDSSSRSSSPEPPVKRRAGPLSLLVHKMESEVAFHSAKATLDMSEEAAAHTADGAAMSVGATDLSESPLQKLEKERQQVNREKEEERRLKEERKREQQQQQQQQQEEEREKKSLEEEKEKERRQLEEEQKRRQEEEREKERKHQEEKEKQRKLQEEEKEKERKHQQAEKEKERKRQQDEKEKERRQQYEENRKVQQQPLAVKAKQASSLVVVDSGSSSDSDSKSDTSSPSSQSSSSSHDQSHPAKQIKKADQGEERDQTNLSNREEKRHRGEREVSEPSAAAVTEVEPDSESTMAQQPASGAEPENSEGRLEESTTPKAFAARKISLTCSKTTPATTEGGAGESEMGTAAGRKRRWGSSTAVTAKKPSITITTDSLKSLIPDIKVGTEAVVELHPEELQLSGDEENPESSRDDQDKGLKIRRTVTQVVPSDGQENGQGNEEEEEDKENEKTDREKQRRTSKDKRKNSHSEEAAETQTSVKPDTEAKKVTPSDSLVRRSISQQKSGVSVTIDDPVRAARQPSPPRGKVSNIVHVTNLVRPFTLSQLKELLNQTGTLVEDGFWIDKIKSHCFVTYATTEEAVATREALHGVKWPQSNPKVLCVDFCEQDELDFHKGILKPDKEEEHVVQPAGPPSRLPPLMPERDRERPRDQDRERDRDRDRGVVGVRDLWAEREREMERRERARGEREWDRDKVREFARPGEEGRRSRSRDRERRRRERAKSKERKTDKKEKADEPPSKMLDDLFLKTKAAPCIYWLPLTEEQAAQRILDRAERQKERERIRKERHEEEGKKREEEKKEKVKGREKEGAVNASSGAAGRGGDGDRDRDRGRDREADKKRDGQRPRRPSVGTGSGRRSRSRSNPKDRRR
ncbi:apoptotic chromatin condensation inducer 1b isoform X2 [Genypterus blacodes]|uniref:apoptotic chromatin condensation inducer 1b isoform X2 n=1 Tax=Genypterus blacodes TaxID=154954 RepID=UPI003F772AEE